VIDGASPILRAGLAGLVASCTVAAVACGGAHAERATATGSAPAEDPRVRRGDFVQRFLMTGALEAVRSDRIIVPPNPSWQIQIRWMEEDGARVKRGQKVVELDNTALVGELDEKTLAVLELRDELVQQRADLSGQEEDKRFQLEQKRIELEKAEIDASVPESILDRRDYQERQLALSRARTEYAKVRVDLVSFHESAKAQIAVLEIGLGKAEREVEEAERAIETLVLRAPRDGLLVIDENRREGRKYQVGDLSFTGLTVARLPDLSNMRVEGFLTDVDDGRIKIGDAATCTMDAYPELSIPCRVIEITPIAREPQFRSLRRNFRVMIELGENYPDRMRPGMSVKVEVEAFRLPDTLLAPRGALDLEIDPPVAFLRGGGDREVRIGACNALECIVEDGLSEGDRLRHGP
jgi:multidrug resistance efflux pump